MARCGSFPSSRRCGSGPARRVPTPSDVSTSLRAAREALVADPGLRGGAFGRALADLLDGVLTELVGTALEGDAVSLVALGSYAKRELCPGSDIDLLLLHAVPRRRAGAVRELAERLWYPLWDAGFVTGHAARTVKETLALADADIDALTALFQARHVAGDPDITETLVTGARGLAERRRERVVTMLTEAAALRELRPGPVAEMLEPDLKDGAGGVRDVQSLEWAGFALGSPGGLERLEQSGYLSGDDVPRLVDAARALLDVRVALHRVSGGRSDRLTLQDQDAVAAMLDVADADLLARDVAAVGREVAWIARDVWDRLRHGLTPPGRRSEARDRVIVPGVMVRDGRIAVSGAIDVLTVLEAAVVAAEEQRPFERESLERLAEMPDPTWDVWQRAAFIRLLRAGRGAVPVFEALDHAHVLVRLLPEWSLVRFRPQRNAYHRFTVDRHLLEALAEGAALLDAGDGPLAADDDIDVRASRACRRPELLLLGALLHDIGKGSGGNHSEVGADIASDIAMRMSLDGEGREILRWLVHDHLLMADTAARRDLSDLAVVERFVEACAGDPERVRLLYLLTIADSKATGPAAWSRTKAALLRDLFVKAAHLLDTRGTDALMDARRAGLAGIAGERAAGAHLARLPGSYVLAFDAEEMAIHQAMLVGEVPCVECRADEHGVASITVVASDRPGLLTTIAGALAIAGLSVREAQLFSTTDGIALDVFRAVDPYGRLADDGDDRVRTLLRRALVGDLDVEAGVRDRRAAYRRPGPSGPIEVRIDLAESETATIVEVEADDDLGVLHQLASVFAQHDVDVTLAKVLTLGDRIVDTFYARAAHGEKITDAARLERLHDALAECLVASDA